MDKETEPITASRGILEFSSPGPLIPLSNHSDSSTVEEASKYEKVWRYLQEREGEITHLQDILEGVRSSLTSKTDPAAVCDTIQQQLTLEKHIERLQEEGDAIRWQVISRQSTLTFGDSAAWRFLDIQTQVIQSTGALCALGASLALSLLYSGTRGQMFFHFSAWWFFLIGLILAAALGFTASGSDDTVRRPTQRNWTIRRFTLFGTLCCVIAAVGGFYCFAAAVIQYDLKQEIETGIPVINGPTPGGFHKVPVQTIVAFIVCAVFAVFFVSGFVLAMQPGFRFGNRKERRSRKLVMHESSRHRTNKATTLGDILGEDTT